MPHTIYNKNTSFDLDLSAKKSFSKFLQHLSYTIFKNSVFFHHQIQLHNQKAMLPFISSQYNNAPMPLWFHYI